MDRKMPCRLLDNLDLSLSEKLVLFSIYQNKSSSRVQLSEQCGLSGQSLTRITKKFLDQGLILEGSRKKTGERGQPAVFLSMAPKSIVSLGLVIEHDGLSCSARDLCGNKLFLVKLQGDYQSAKKALAEGKQLLELALSQIPQDAYVVGTGISVSGLFVSNKERRYVVSRNDLEGWRKVDIHNPMELSMPMQFKVENDGRAAAVGHSISGIGKPYHSFFSILMTKGIGGGFIHKNRVLNGFNHNAGEIAELTPKTPALIRPTLESFHQVCEVVTGNKNPLNEDLVQLLQTPHELVEQWLSTNTEILENICRSISVFCDPEAIILAGRLPFEVRAELKQRITLQSLSFMQETVTPPTLIVDPSEDALIDGASALPLFQYFKHSFL